MTKLLLTPQAENDLEEIYVYTSLNWGIEQADRYQDDLYRGIQLILEDHDLGMEYPFSNFDYRRLHINRHLIFYRIEDDECRIIRILHDLTNLKQHM